MARKKRWDPEIVCQANDGYTISYPKRPQQISWLVKEAVSRKRVQLYLEISSVIKSKAFVLELLLIEGWKHKVFA